eukprot:3325305-Rhodomonas_salina.1
MGVPRRDRAGARYPDAMDCGQVDRRSRDDLELTVEHAKLEKVEASRTGLEVGDGPDATVLMLHDRNIIRVHGNVKRVGVRRAVPRLHRLHVLVVLETDD